MGRTSRHSLKFILLERLLKELQALGGDLLSSWLHLPPDSRCPGDHLHVGRKRLDNDIALVLDRLERSDDRLPVDVVIARCAAVAAAGVKVPEVFAGGADGLGLVFSSMFM